MPLRQLLHLMALAPDADGQVIHEVQVLLMILEPQRAPVLTHKLEFLFRHASFFQICPKLGTLVRVVQPMPHTMSQFSPLRPTLLNELCLVGRPAFHLDAVHPAWPLRDRQ